MLKCQSRTPIKAEEEGEEEEISSSQPSSLQPVSSSSFRGSVLFDAVRVIGRVIDRIPFAIGRVGTEDFITCSLGRSFQVLDGQNLRIVFSSPPLPHRKIRALNVDHDTVYTAGRHQIYAWRKLDQIAKFVHASSPCGVDTPECKIRGMMIFGTWLLSYTGICLYMWDKETGRRIHQFDRSFFFSLPSFSPSSSTYQKLPTITCLYHPDTYLNKILVGFDSGDLLLLNLRTRTIVHHVRCMYTTTTTSSLSFSSHGQKNRLSGDDLQSHLSLDDTSDFTDDSSSSLLDSSEVDDENGEERPKNEKGDRKKRNFQENRHPAGETRRLHALSSSLLLPSSTSSSSSERSSPVYGGVTCLTGCPQNSDIVAVGYTSGKIAILDLKKDELLLEFSHSSSQGSVTSLAFRPSQSAAFGGSALSSGWKAPIETLVSAANNGDLLVWNLEKGCFLGCIDTAHTGGRITRIQFYPGQPIMISSGEDNCVTMWIFDLPDGMPRELRSRRGHVGSVSFMKFYGDSSSQEGLELLTASCLGGRGFVGQTSFVQQQRNCTFSSKLFRKKAMEWGFPSRRLPGIVDISFASSRHYDWPNVVSVHCRSHTALVWSFHHKTLVPQALRVSRHSTAAATAVAVSGCGNFVVVGYSDGSMHRFNLQSCLHRGEFKRPPHLQKKNKHHLLPSNSNSPICSVAILNSSTVVSATSHPSDLGLYLHSLSQHTFQRRIELDDDRRSLHKQGDAISSFKPSEGALIAVVLQSGTVLLVDVLAESIVRKISHPQAPASSLAFSPDGRWLAIASSRGPLGSTLYIYDILSAAVIDWLRFKTPVLCLTFDPTGTFLLTSHPHARGGVYVWANKYAFDPSLTAPLLSSSPTEPFDMEEPHSATPCEYQFEEKVEQERQMKEKGKREEREKALLGVVAKKSQKTPLFEGALTLSGLPAGRLQALMYIEEIKEKCKPVEPAAAPRAAPFFLPTRFDGTTPKFVLEGGEDFEANEGKKDSVSPDGPSGEALSAMKNEEDAIAFFQGLGNTNAGGRSEGEKTTTPNKRGDTRIFNRDTGGGLDLCSNLQKLLRAKENETKKEQQSRYMRVLHYLKGLSPSAVSLALHELGPLAGGTEHEFVEMMKVFKLHALKRHEADLVQSLLNVFLKAHGDVLMRAEPGSELASLSQDLENLLKRDWQSIEQQFLQLQCYLKFLTHLQMDS
ncbi:wd g-beta repeat-containing protein [Cystoisospora suis]|uniref:Wd g-beta repeat-containing protein n=1 Tax=Cystoisospora suis TaxID=483139 RepID=A0A2C6KFC0_9APIC|nr:wd g-beta repeat-containing protein [Cystoisospora suis]